MPSLSKTLADALQQQVNREFWSAYLYLSMSTYCDDIGYRGAAQWLRSQWQEEQAHALKIMDFLGDRGTQPLLYALEEPAHEFGTLLEVFEEVLAHEEKVTALIHNLCDLAHAEKDRATQTFLDWFVTEQIEEESSAQEIIDRLRLAGDNVAAVLMVDSELGTQREDSAGPEGAEA